MIQGISELTCRHFEPHLHMSTAEADGPRAWLKALASPSPEDSRVRYSRELLRVRLQSKKIHPRGRCRIGNHNVRYKGPSRRGIPR